MRFLQITTPLRLPHDECASCGATSGLKMRPMRLVKTEVAMVPGVLFAADESRAEWTVPACEICAPALSRLRPTGAQFIVVWVGLALILFLGATVPLVMNFPAESWPLVIPPVFATLMMVGWYGTRGPRYYQPLWLRVARGDTCIVGVSRDEFASKLHTQNPGSRLGSAVRQRALIA